VGFPIDAKMMLSITPEPGQFSVSTLLIVRVPLV
jgi:hypothetical protein